MLRTLIILYVILTPAINYSQDYTPLAIEGATWFIAPYGETAETPYAYRIDGDSIYNNVLYKKLYYNTLEYVYDEFTMINQIGFVSRHLIGLLRDDISNRRVYYVNLTNITSTNDSECSLLLQDNINQEVLLYNFDITVNDTIDNCITQEFQFGGKVVTSDTIINIYNQDRRTLMADNNDMIEGIGFDRGLLSPLSVPFHAGKGTTFFYCVGSLFDCNVLIANYDILKENHPNIYPIPTNSFLFIDSEISFEKLKIYNCFGKLLSEQPFINSIEVYDFESGNYILELITNENKSHITRFIKI